MTSQAWQQQLDGAQQKAHIFAYKKDNRKKGGRKAHAPQAWCLLDPETNTQEKFNALDDSERADLKKKFKTTQHAARALCYPRCMQWEVTQLMQWKNRTSLDPGCTGR